eukprot:2358046-Lingulodinium_polyedra.AAC.1
MPRGGDEGGRWSGVLVPIAWMVLGAMPGVDGVARRVLFLRDRHAAVWRLVARESHTRQRWPTA